VQVVHNYGEDINPTVKQPLTLQRWFGLIRRVAALCGS